MASSGLEFPDRFQDALLFAATHHAEQVRKGTAIPYITHPLSVAETLAYYYPTRHELIVAAVLHDVVEDTPASLEDVAARFGRDVATLVQAVTKPQDEKSLPSGKVARWRAQREGMLAAIRSSNNLDTSRLKAADALANLNAIRRDLDNPSVGSRVWERFKVGREDSLWYYREVVAALAPIADEPLVRDLERALKIVASPREARKHP